MRIIILFLLFSCCSGLLAQQVVATSGNTFVNSSGSISYTIGEGVAQTLKKGDKVLTQGFHQTSITVITEGEMKDLEFSIIVFPNPASRELKVKVDKENISGLEYLLYDLNGKLILQKNLEGAETTIPFEQLSSGLYILKVQFGLKELKSFKIIKQ